MPFLAKYAVRALLIIALVAMGLTPSARGQSQKGAKTENPDADDQGWHAEVAPYLWFAGIDGTVGADGHQSSVHVTASDVLSNLNFGIMGAVEARYDRIVIPIDFMRGDHPAEMKRRGRR